MIAPYPKVNDLIDRLGALAPDPNEFHLRGIEREAKALLKHDAHGAYIALAIIAALRSNAAEAISYHEKSLKISNDSLTRRLYIASLNNLQLYREALQQADIALAQTPSPELLEINIEACIRTAQPRRAIDYHQKLVKLIPDLQPNPHRETLMQTADILASTGLTDQELTEINAIAETVARERSARIVGSRVWANIWEVPYFVCQELHVIGADYSDLVDDLIDKFVETDSPAIRNPAYHVTFRHPTPEPSA